MIALVKCPPTDDGWTISVVTGGANIAYHVQSGVSPKFEFNLKFEILKIYFENTKCCDLLQSANIPELNGPGSMSARMRATTASPVQRAPTPLPALRARAARELSGTGRQTDRDACPWSMNVLPTLGWLIIRGRYSGSRSRNDSLSIPNPDVEFQIFQTQYRIPIRNLEICNFIPESRNL